MFRSLWPGFLGAGVRSNLWSSRESPSEFAAGILVANVVLCSSKGSPPEMGVKPGERVEDICKWAPYLKFSKLGWPLVQH